MYAQWNTQFSLFSDVSFPNDYLKVCGEKKTLPIHQDKGSAGNLFSISGIIEIHTYMIYFL